VLEEQERAKKAAMLQYVAQQFRVTVLDILHDKGTGHWGGTSSSAELLTALYFHAMTVRPDEPSWPDRDRLVLSKGHASCMLYTVLANRGYFPAAELDSFRQLDSRLQGHPCMTSTPGVDMSTGSLGHGVSVTLGMALAGRLQERSYWSYVVMGEGDLDERQTWEALMAAATFRPSRLLVMVDYNKVQLDGPSDAVMPLDPLAEKFRAFNWNVPPQVFDGHSVAEVFDSFDWARRQPGGPLAIIYRTCKGRGVSFMENNAYWHGAPIDDANYAKARQELLQTLNELEARL
jgi:transketolase